MSESDNELGYDSENDSDNESAFDCIYADGHKFSCHEDFYQAIYINEGYKKILRLDICGYDCKLLKNYESIGI